MKTKKSTIRTFIAVSLPDHVKAFLTQGQKDLRKEGIKGAFPDPETLHLTLKFLGDIHMEQLRAVEQCMEKAVSGIKAPLLISAAGMGVFPTVRRPRIVWSGINGDTDRIGRIVKQLNQQLYETLLLGLDKKRYTPHLTLVRMKTKIPPQKMVGIIQKFQNTGSEFFEVKSIDLYKSKLLSNGAKHTKIFSVPISGNNN